MSTTPGSSPHHVELSVPLHTQFAATLRVLTASLGADASFSIDEIDDLKLAINEVFVLLAEEYPDATAIASFELDRGELSVTVRAEPADQIVELDELAQNILRSAIDSFTSGPNGITLTKRATESVEGR